MQHMILLQHFLCLILGILILIDLSYIYFSIYSFIHFEFLVSLI